jgi:hypothetical protein
VFLRYRIVELTLSKWLLKGRIGESVRELGKSEKGRMSPSVGLERRKGILVERSKGGLVRSLRLQSK